MVTAHPQLCSEAGIVWVPEHGECPGAWAVTMALVCLWPWTWSRTLSHAPDSQQPWEVGQALALVDGETEA